MPAEHRDHTVFVLGAGFSARGGVPTMATFLQNIREFYDTSTKAMNLPQRERYGRVLEARHNAGRCRDLIYLDLDNIETLFGLIDMDEVVTQRHPKGAHASSATSDDIKHVLAHTVERSYERTARLARIELPRTALDGLRGEKWLREVEAGQTGAKLDPRDQNIRIEMPLYDYVVAMMIGMFEANTRDQFSSAIVTFNYDTLVEQSLLELGRKVDYAVTHAPVQGKRLRAASKRPPTRVLKLHGSANWAYVSKKNTRAHIFDSYEDFSHSHTPILVPPTWRKGDVSELMRETWAAAFAEIANATRVVVIGYSAPETDAHFKHLMATALARNPRLYSLTVVDWARDSMISTPVAERYQSLFGPLVQYGRFQYVDAGMHGFFFNGPGGLLCAEHSRLGEAVNSAMFFDPDARSSLRFGR